MTSDAWMTYIEAAAALGMTVESVRQRARREGWRRTLGNDGKARVQLPLDTARVPAGDDNDNASAPRPRHRPEPDTAHTALIEAHRAQIATLEARAVELRVDLDRERDERVEERARAERLVDEVASLARDLAVMTSAAADRERVLQDRATAAEAELVSVRARSWWRRLAG